jgi:four helix bundle protein
MQILHCATGKPRDWDGFGQASALRSISLMREGIDQLENRTKQFTIRAIRLCAKLEVLPGLRNAAYQLSSASGSVGSNHRAMRRARSDREFAAKLQIVCEESDESVFWLEVSEATCPQFNAEIVPLLTESRELRAIFMKARATNRGRGSN